MTNLIVNEEFHSIQGEGPNTGMNAYFVRTTGCELVCNFCDSAATWSFSKKKAALHRDNIVYSVKDEAHSTPIEGIFDRIDASNAPLVVITGGSPLLHQEKLVELVELLLDRTDCQIEFETAGTIMPVTALAPQYRLRYNVSPKLANSGNPLEVRYNEDVLRYLADSPTSAFKFVVSSLSDLDEISDMINQVGIDNRQVYLMPEGVSTDILDARLGWLGPLAVKLGYNISSRLHIQIFGDKRGT